MLGILGVVLYNLVYGAIWLDANTEEIKQRNDSYKNNQDFYFDKNGKMRHTLTGTKYNDEEIHNFINPLVIQTQEENFWEKKYFGVWNRNVSFVTEVFLTEEEAQNYIDTYNSNALYNYKIIHKVCEKEMEINPSGYHKNF